MPPIRWCLAVYIGMMTDCCRMRREEFGLKQISTMIAVREMDIEFYGRMMD